MTKLQLVKEKAYKVFREKFEELKIEFENNGLTLIKPIWDELEIDDLLNEKWKPVVGYESFYLVSNYGRIKSLPKAENSYRDKILRQYFDGPGYIYCSLKGKKYKSHRIVGLSRIANPLNKPTINHKNGIKWVNAEFNLEWNTPGENQRHALDTGFKVPKKGRAVHNAMPVVQYDLNGKFVREWDTMKLVEKTMNIDDAPISKCCKLDKNYGQAYGYIWRFEKDVLHLGHNSDLPKSQIHFRYSPKFKARRKTTILNKLLQ